MGCLFGFVNIDRAYLQWHRLRRFEKQMFLDYMVDLVVLQYHFIQMGVDPLSFTCNKVSIVISANMGMTMQSLHT